MRRIIRRVLFGLLGAGVVAAALFLWLLQAQGVPASHWDSYATARVRFDAEHVPTIEAADWMKAIEAQGYVVATERLWQMDLTRRKASGRLAEWFGPDAVAHDARMRAEDRAGVAARAAELLPPEEAAVCEAYAAGVNAFVAGNKGRWGIEYLMLGAEPEPWRCADTLLVVLEMADYLTSSATTDAAQTAWKRQLPPAWQDYLFTQEHPWATPLFGRPRGVRLPPVDERLPPATLGDETQAAGTFVDRPPIGSNSWAWSGPTGTYLANDPHLGQSVPQLWMAQRLRVAADDWVVGVALPGIPGVVIGMNPALAWSFTNTGEDVDDYLRETLSEDGTRYLASRDESGREEWREVGRRTAEIRVRGEDEPRRVESLYTHRGPLAVREHLGDALHARQWLPLQEGLLRIPMLSFIRARTVADMDRAVDGMRAPAQNVVFALRDGTIGYRVAGTGVKRRATGLVAQDALEGAWERLQPPSERKRLVLPKAVKARAIVTANERMWTDGYGSQWWGEDRKERITRALAAREDFGRVDMETLQLDTESRFRRELLRWVATHARADDEATRELAERWKGWDGTSRSDPVAFAAADRVEKKLVDVCLARVKRAFLRDDATRQVPFVSHVRRGWIVQAITTAEGFAAFGLDSAELATHLLADVAAADEVQPHPDTNLWDGQHPFARRLPVLGRLFRVASPPQWGAHDVVLAETPRHGPSVRLVFDLTRPLESTWAFPVGQSGHIGSRHYADWQERWFQGEARPIFPSGEAW